DAARLVLGGGAGGDAARKPPGRAPAPEVVPRGERGQCARVVHEAGEVANSGRLDDAVEKAVDAERAVVEPPRAAEQHCRVVAGERRELAAVRALVESEEDQREARLVAACLEQWLQAARPVGSDGDVGAEVAAEARSERRIV